MSSTRTVEYDAHGRLAGDLTCVSCGHNLRGLALEDRCGECGSPVEWTVRGDPLYFCDPDWLRCLRSGTACLAVVLPWLWFPPAWILVGIGVARLTTPTPSISARYGSNRAADFRRFLVIVVTLAGGAPLAILWGLLLDPAGAAVRPDFVLWLTLAVAEAWAILVVVIMLAIARIEQGGSRAMRRACRRGAIVAMVAGFLLLVAVGVYVSGKNDKVAAVLGIVGGVTMLVTVPALCIPLFRTWRTLDIAVIHAEDSRRRRPVWLRPSPGLKARQGAAATSPSGGPSRGRG